MSAHADKTLHWKILGNINDTDTFPYIFSLTSGMNLCTNFVRISCTNLSTNVLYRFLIEKLRNEKEDKMKMQITQSFNQYSENETKIWQQNILNQFNRVSWSNVFILIW